MVTHKLLFGFIGDAFEDKRVVIAGHHPQLLSKLGLDETTWVTLANRFGKDYQGAVGSLEELASFVEHTGTCWIASKTNCDEKFINFL